LLHLVRRHRGDWRHDHALDGDGFLASFRRRSDSALPSELDDDSDELPAEIMALITNDADCSIAASLVILKSCKDKHSWTTESFRNSARFDLRLQDCPPSPSISAFFRCLLLETRRDSASLRGAKSSNRAACRKAARCSVEKGEVSDALARSDGGSAS